MDWSKIKKDNLTVMWKSGLMSAQQIADKLGGGVTRNAVIGMARRLKISQSANGHRVRGRLPGEVWVPKTRKPRQYAPVSIKMRPRLHDSPPAPKTAPEPLKSSLHPLTFMQLSGQQCKFALAGPTDGPVMFCGDPAVGSWCPYHARLIHQPPQPRTKVVPHYRR